jgi:diacylglycerol kinase family enzyme
MVVRGIHLKREGVEHRRVRRVEVSATETVPVQLDGDPGGFVSPSAHGNGIWAAEVLPRAIEVMVPGA